MSAEQQSQNDLSTTLEETVVPQETKPKRGSKRKAEGEPKPKRATKKQKASIVNRITLGPGGTVSNNSVVGGSVFVIDGAYTLDRLQHASNITTAVIDNGNVVYKASGKITGPAPDVTKMINSLPMHSVRSMEQVFWVSDSSSSDSSFESDDY